MTARCVYNNFSKVFKNLTINYGCFKAVKLIEKQSSRGGLVVKRLLHKKCHSATADQIPLETL